MKKQLLVVAAASAFASTLPVQAADFQVGSGTTLTLSGLIAVGVKGTEVTDTALPKKQEMRVDDNTSRFIIAGNSEIAPGYKVIFRCESRFTVDTRPGAALAPGSTLTVANATGLADGDTWGGIATPVGSFVFGKSALYYQDSMDAGYLGLPGPGEGYRAWDAQGLAFFNLLSQVGVTTKTTSALVATLGITRSQNVMRFDSVAWKGLEFTLAFSKNPSGDETHYASAPGTLYASGGTWYGRVKYNDGGFSAVASVLDQQVQGATYTPASTAGPMNTHAYRLAAGYRWQSGFKIGAVYDVTGIDNAAAGIATAKRGVVSVPASYSWGRHAVYATYTSANAAGNIADNGAKQYNLGYDYALTKRAFAGIFYTNLKDDANGVYTPFLTNTALGGTAAGKGEGYKQVGICLNYWF